LVNKRDHSQVSALGPGQSMSLVISATTQDGKQYPTVGVGKGKVAFDNYAIQATIVPEATALRGPLRYRLTRLRSLGEPRLGSSLRSRGETKVATQVIAPQPGIAEFAADLVTED
jgi:hypothetical protein